MSDKLVLTRRQETRIRNVFAKKMSTDVKFIKTKLPKINQWGRFIDALLGKLANQLMKVGVPLAKRFLTLFSTTASASEIVSVIQRKLYKQEVRKTGVKETIRTNRRNFRCFNVGNVFTEKMDELNKSF